MNIRTFIALELSHEAKQELARLEETFRQADADARWVNPESIHLTLKFLGSISEEKIPGIMARLEGIASGETPFYMTLDSAGVFPKWDRAKVLWAGIGKGARRIKDIADKVSASMEVEGFEKESREFKSHVTIGRMRSAKNKDKLREIVESTKVNPVSSRISSIILFRSDLSKAGAQHTPLAMCKFKK